MSKYENAVCDKIQRRAEFGLKKYGVTPTGDPILWLQMKGSKTEDKIGRDRSPQFHIVENWPKEFVIYEETNI